LEKWQSVLGVQSADWRVKKMKTKWGCCQRKPHRVASGVFRGGRLVAELRLSRGCCVVGVCVGGYDRTTDRVGNGGLSGDSSGTCKSD